MTASSRSLKAVLHVFYFLSGIGTVLIGQVLPIMAKRFELNDLGVSDFFPAQFAGSIAGTLVASRFGKRSSHIGAAVLGGLMMAVGLALMNVESFYLCLGGFLINGIGIGLTLPSINLIVLELNPTRSASALSLLNFCWGAGAILCKPFVDALSSDDRLGATTWLLAAAILVLTLALLPAVGTMRHHHVETVTDASEPPIWTTTLAWMIALFNFIHVGFESGIGGWLTTYTGRVEGAPLWPWLSPTLLYFLFFVIGRGVAPVLFRYLEENGMLILGLTIVLAGMLIILAAPNVAMLSIGAVVSGTGTSWIFPTNVSRFSKTFGAMASRRATPLFICGTLGAALSTRLIGYVSEQMGSLHAGMYVLLIAIVMLIVLQLVLIFGTKKAPELNTPGP